MNIRKAVTAAIARSRREQVAFLAALVRKPSDNPQGDCAPHALMTAKLLADMGFRVERHPVPAAEARAVGMQSAINLVVRQRFGRGGVQVRFRHLRLCPVGAEIGGGLRSKGG